MNYIFDAKIQMEEKPLINIFLQFAIVIIFCYGISLAMSTIWTNNVNLLHTIVEMVCVFIALSGFFVIWHIYDKVSSVNILVGFGFLMVATFDMLHTCYLPSLGLNNKGVYDLFTWYWISGRITEAIILFITAFKLIEITINKWILLISVAGLTISISTFIFYNAYWLPVLQIEGHGVTPIKIIMEYIVILISLCGLFCLRKKINNRDVLTYRYIFIALLFAIPAELCFTLFKTPSSFVSLMGHVLKITYYYYLYRGIFVSAITFPYKKMELANSFMTDILNYMPIGITSYDYEGKVTFVNKKAEELYGCKVEELIGLRDINIDSMFKYTNKVAFQQVDSDSQNIKKNNMLSSIDKTLHNEASIITLDGKRRDIIKQTSLIHNVGGDLIGIIDVTTDITDIKKAQLTIQQQEKLALLGQMASGIVHEIKNPLTTIKGFCQMLIYKAKDEKLKSYAELINSETEAVNKVVTDFLEFARPRKPILKEVSVQQMVDSMQAMLDSQLFIKNIGFDITHEVETFPVMADESQLKQVILNLVKNAIDAMDGIAKPKVNIITGCDRNKNQIFISVVDNGKGMSQEEVSKLGAPFFTTKEKGTGLGMSICYQIINEHGGIINVDSELGRGTTFTITLPVKKTLGQSV